MATLSPLVIGRVEKGVFIPKDAEKFRAAFRCHEGKDVEFTPVRHRVTRSLKQNKYYWKVIVLLVADAMGDDDPEAVHAVLKNECNYEIRTFGKGADRKEYRYPLSTADLSTVEFEAYTERCRRFAAEFFGIYIPLPNEVMPS